MPRAQCPVLRSHPLECGKRAREASPQQQLRLAQVGGRHRDTPGTVTQPGALTTQTRTPSRYGTGAAPREVGRHLVHLAPGGTPDTGQGQV